MIQFQCCQHCDWVMPKDEAKAHPPCGKCGRIGTLNDVPLELAALAMLDAHRRLVAAEQEKWIKWTGRPPRSKSQYLLTTDSGYALGMYDDLNACWVGGGGRYAIRPVYYYRECPPWPSEPPMDLAKLPKVSAKRAAMDQSGQKRRA